MFNCKRGRKVVVFADFSGLLWLVEILWWSAKNIGFFGSCEFEYIRLFFSFVFLFVKRNVEFVGLLCWR